MKKQVVTLIALCAVILCSFTAWGAPFNPTGALATARDSHTATLLTGGKVLVTGGLSGPDTVASTEIYDPGAGTWSAGGNLTAARSSHTATLLANGKVLIAGGFGSTSSAVRSAELYDPATNTFTATGSMATPRAYHSATLLADGKVLIAGGLNSSDLATAEIYDPAAGTFTATGNLTSARQGHTATLLTDGTVVILGGSTNGTVQSNGMFFLPASGTFSQTKTGFTSNGVLMSGQRTLHTATLLPNGKILVTGGQGNSSDTVSAELFDQAATGSAKPYATTGSMAVARELHTATLLPNGKVLITGGSSNGVSLNSAELYDPAAGTFSATAATMNAMRGYHSATLLASGNVLITGGSDGSASISSAEVYFTWPAPPAQTGQTSCWDSAGVLLTSCTGTGQTGETRAGIAWPTPRFVDNSNGTVTDNLTGLVWLKNANCFGTQTWASAVASANGLANGACGLTDGSSAGQWRLPNVLELRSLVNEQQMSQSAWLNTQGFINVQGVIYICSTTITSLTTNRFSVGMWNGEVRPGSSGYVWPVRDGQ